MYAIIKLPNDVVMEGVVDKYYFSTGSMVNVVIDDVTYTAHTSDVAFIRGNE